MRVQFVEIQNFRKLKAVRLDFSDKTTVLVGANNSGKTSAMVALGHFLVDQGRFTMNDFTLSNWTKINQIGIAWEALAANPSSLGPTLSEWEGLLPSLDVWLQVGKSEIHHVAGLLPDLDWEEGLLGIRLQLEPKNLENLYKKFTAATTAATETKKAAEQKKGSKFVVALWPGTMCNFLERELRDLFEVRSYSLNPTKHKSPVNGVAHPQLIPPGSSPIEGDPFKGLIRINEINAQRGFSDADTRRNRSGEDESDSRSSREKHKLSGQLRSYYSKHLDPSSFPEASDVEALEAIDTAQREFDKKLETSFSVALEEVENLGYPGITDPRLRISTKLRPADGLNHEAAVQYEVISQIGKAIVAAPRLPEDYNGLGYQNLISMVFRLMSFRDAWMQVGKAGKKVTAESGKDFFLPPLHLVLVEEPEAHLHAQVQQVFIREAYKILRKHSDLGEKEDLATQLVISTHSSHVAHECDFSHLRYFRRHPPVSEGDVPTSTIVNLSEVFGEPDETQKFVIRYLKATHCDLFFADAAIFVEGPAERMLVPHFIREHFERLSRCYITLLEIGGSHAHRLRDLVQHLGLVTLIIADIDSAESHGKHSPIPPARGKGQITRNFTLKDWIPKKESVDDLLDATEAEKTKIYDSSFAVRVAYQCPVKIQLDKTQTPAEALAYTFEDALVFENIELFKKLTGDGMVQKFNEAVKDSKTPDELGQALFAILRKGNKAEFALDILYLKEPKTLAVPTYISEGLSWLQELLKRKQDERLHVAELSSATSGQKA